VSANGTYFGDALVLADGGWQVTGAVDKNRQNHRLEFILIDNVRTGCCALSVADAVT
jgi:hypothetical protein